MAKEELSPEVRNVLGEYILRQKAAGRDSVPLDEIKIAIEAIKAAVDVLAE